MNIPSFITSFQSIGDQVFLRCDPKYRHFWDNSHGYSLKPNKNVEDVKLRNELLPFNKKVLNKGLLTEDRIILDLADVESRTSLILQERIVDEIGSAKLDFADCDLVVNRLEPYLGKIVINDESKGYIGTTEWIPLRINNTRVNSLFLKYLLLLPQFLHSFRLLKSGKRHARMAYVDFRNVNIPLPSPEEQTILAKKILPLEKNMLSLHGSLANPLSIINDIFAREYSYSVDEYNNKANITIYNRTFSTINKSIALRSSVRFHRPKYDYLDGIIRKYECKKLGALCLMPIHRGVQPHYDKVGSIFVIKTANLQNGFIDTSEVETVNDEFYIANKNISGIETGDILVTSTGVGSIGKVDMYEFDDAALADGHVSIVRLNEKDINPKYLLYYLRSILGYSQIERNYSGATNQIEIYPDQLEHIRIIDISRDKQDCIVKEIQTELLSLQNQKMQIRKLRDQVDSIVLKAIGCSASLINEDSYS
jgi:type I restriction enzyme S subunit